MPSLYTILQGGSAASADINQIVNTLTGSQNTPVTLRTTDPIAFSLQVENTDAAGKALLIYAPDSTTVLQRVQASGVSSSPDGTGAAPVVTTTHIQTLTNKTLTSPHMTGPIIDSGNLVIDSTGANNSVIAIGQAAGGSANRLQIKGVAGNYASVLTSAGGAGANFGSLITAGTTGADYALNVQTNEGTSRLSVRGDGAVFVGSAAGAVGFFSSTVGIAKQTVTGAKGANAALASLLAALVAYNLITDSTTA